MCGIAGFFSYDSNAPAPSLERLERLCDDMYRRGPDANGQWSSKEGRVLLGHRRLSILDLSENANQPMVDRASGCVLVFNGEIYNFRELRLELEQSGYTFKSRGDSEVLLKGYQHWGEGMLKKLRGMFAIALWDPRKRALWLARDPYGIKPLYYREDKDINIMNIASEVKALVGFGTEGIREVPPGHYWASDKGFVRYFIRCPDRWYEKNC